MPYSSYFGQTPSLPPFFIPLPESNKNSNRAGLQYKDEEDPKLSSRSSQSNTQNNQDKPQQNSMMSHYMGGQIPNSGFSPGSNPLLQPHHMLSNPFATAMIPPIMTHPVFIPASYPMPGSTSTQSSNDQQQRDQQVTQSSIQQQSQYQSPQYLPFQPQFYPWNPQYPY
jgi:hypothetical protein